MTDKTGALIESKEALGLTVTEVLTAEVGCDLSYTKNLGNYQSARFSVSIKAPSNIDPDSLDKTFTYLAGWCDTKLSQLIKDAVDALA